MTQLKGPSWFTMTNAPGPTCGQRLIDLGGGGRAGHQFTCSLLDHDPSKVWHEGWVNGELVIIWEKAWNFAYVGDL